MMRVRLCSFIVCLACTILHAGNPHTSCLSYCENFFKGFATGSAHVSALALMVQNQFSFQHTLDSLVLSSASGGLGLLEGAYLHNQKNRSLLRMVTDSTNLGFIAGAAVMFSLHYPQAKEADFFGMPKIELYIDCSQK